MNMAVKIKLSLDGVDLRGELLDSSSAKALAKSLPLEISMSRWGEEYYGSIGASLDGLSGPTQEVMAVGDLAYWEPGTAFCVFFGPTPASRGALPVAAGPVHLVGKVSGDWQAVKALGQAVTAVLERA
jgi:uncharacterized protein